MNGYREITKRLVEARKFAGLTQEQAAKLLGMKSASSLSHYETTAREIPLWRFLELCVIYGVSPAWVITGINPAFDARQIGLLLNSLGDDAQRIVDILTMRVGDA